SQDSRGSTHILFSRTDEGQIPRQGNHRDAFLHSHPDRCEMNFCSLLFLLSASTVLADGLPVAQLERSTPVDFEREVMPFLRDNCLSCHCQTTTKAGLKLETAEQILKGG